MLALGEEFVTPSLLLLPTSAKAGVQEEQEGEAPKHPPVVHQLLSFPEAHTPPHSPALPSLARRFLLGKKRAK